MIPKPTSLWTVKGGNSVSVPGVGGSVSPVTVDLGRRTNSLKLSPWSGRPALCVRRYLLNKIKTVEVAEHRRCVLKKSSLLSIIYYLVF